MIGDDQIEKYVQDYKDIIGAYRQTISVDDETSDLDIMKRMIDEAIINGIHSYDKINFRAQTIYKDENPTIGKIRALSDSSGTQPGPTATNIDRLTEALLKIAVWHAKKEEGLGIAIII